MMYKASRSFLEKAWGCILCLRSARAWRARVSSRGSSLRGAQYIALDVRAHHPHDVRRGRRVPRVRAPAGRARRVAGRQARREHRRRPGRDARGRRALGAVGPHRRHGRYAGIGFAPRRRRRRASNERRNAGKSVGLSRRASLGPPPVARRPPLSTSAARDEASIRSNDSSRFFSIALKFSLSARRSIRVHRVHYRD